MKKKKYRPLYTAPKGDVLIVTNNKRWPIILGRIYPTQRAFNNWVQHSDYLKWDDLLGWLTLPKP